MLRKGVLWALCALLAASATAPYASATHETETRPGHEWRDGNIEFYYITHNNRWRCDRSSGCTPFANQITGTYKSIAHKSCRYEPDKSGVYTDKNELNCDHSRPENGGWVFLSGPRDHTSTGVPPTCQAPSSWHGDKPVLSDGAVRWTLRGHCGQWVPITCPDGQHRTGDGCHKDHVRPECTESGYYRPHEGHSNWWVGKCKAKPQLPPPDDDEEEDETETETETDTTTTTTSTTTTTTTTPAATTTLPPRQKSCAEQGLYELLDGSCSRTPCAPGSIPVVGSDGKLDYCQDVGNCPYSELPSSYRPARWGSSPHVIFPPVWRRSPDSPPELLSGESTIVSRTVIKCMNIYRVSFFPSESTCLWAEANLRSRGDCLALSLWVRESHTKTGRFTHWQPPRSDRLTVGANWIRSSHNPSSFPAHCGYNYTEGWAASKGSRAWKQSFTSCTSAEARWSNGKCSRYTAVDMCPSPPGYENATWTVTLLDNGLPGEGPKLRAGGTPLVEVPVLVEVSDWGDAQRLIINIQASGGGPSRPWRCDRAAPGQSPGSWPLSCYVFSTEHTRSTTFEVLRAPEPPPVASFATASVEANEGDPLTFTARLNKPAPKPVVLRYSTSPGTAAATDDYTIPAGIAYIRKGGTSATIKVETVDDGFYESDETLTVALTGGQNVRIGTPASATGTIIDNEPNATFSSASMTVEEGETLIFTVSLDKPAGPAGAFPEYTVTDVTATAGVDYTPPAQTNGVSLLSVEAGATSADIEIITIDNSLPESARTLTVNLRASQTSATGTITDNDIGSLDMLTLTCVADNRYTSSPVLRFSWSKPEGSVSSYAVEIFTGTFSGPAPNWAFVKPTDRRVANAQSIASWRTSYNYPRVLNGQKYTGDWSGGGVRAPEWDTKYTLRMRPQSSGRVAPWSHATTTCPPVVSLSPRTLPVNEDTTGGDAVSARVMISLSQAWGEGISVDIETADGTAEAGSDYTALNTTVTIPAGETSVAVFVETIPDTDQEDDETFYISISNPSNGKLGDDTAAVTITDNDNTPIYR